MPRIGALDFPISPLVKAIFLYEPDRKMLKQNMYDRERGSGETDLSEGSFLFGQQLKEDAKNRSIPVVESRPFESLMRRALRELQMEG